VRQAAEEKMQASKAKRLLELSDADQEAKRAKEELNPTELKEAELKDLDNFVCVRGADCTSCQ
jgi:flagellar hook-length control protein FliK